jgi:hypothetical protein
LYVYVGNNPLKYIDPTGNDEIGTISWNVFVTHMNTRQKHGDTGDKGGATIGVVVFVVEGLGFVIQLQGVGL